MLVSQNATIMVTLVVAYAQCLGNYGLCKTPRFRFTQRSFDPTHLGLAWASSPVASQHGYGGVSSGLPVSSC